MDWRFLSISEKNRQAGYSDSPFIFLSAYTIGTRSIYVLYPAYHFEITRIIKTASREICNCIIVYILIKGNAFNQFNRYPSLWILKITPCH